MKHIPVLQDEVIRLLNVKKDELYVDCTIGLGGHSKFIIENGGRVIGIDCDSEALELAKEALSEYKDKMKFKQGNFKDIDRILEESDIKKVSGFLYDLGTSSYQLETKERGFSFMLDGPLDMRMDRRQAKTASQIVNREPFNRLYKIIGEYGEEPRATQIARRIISNRPIQTTSKLTSIITKVYKGKRGKIHPATKTFQALRIAVNDELSNLKDSLDKILPYLEKGGRVVVISFHSLEDRIVKEKFKRWENEGIFNILTKKPITPSNYEIKQNPRARSAKLRAGEKGGNL